MIVINLNQAVKKKEKEEEIPRNPVPILHFSNALKTFFRILISIHSIYLLLYSVSEQRLMICSRQTIQITTKKYKNNMEQNKTKNQSTPSQRANVKRTEELLFLKMHNARTCTHTYAS